MQIVTKPQILPLPNFFGNRNELQFLFPYLKNNLSRVPQGQRSFSLNMLRSKILLQKWHLWAISVKMTPI